MRRLMPLALVLGLVAANSRAEDDAPKGTAEAVAALVKASKSSEKSARADFNKAYAGLSQQLQEKDGAAAAKLIFDKRADFDLGPAAEKIVDGISAQKKPAIAAELLLKIAGSRMTVAQFGKGGVAVGRVVVADGKLDPEFVLAQMPILADGWFAAEVGDMSKPLAFRAAGYADAELSLNGKPGDILDAGTVTLKPLEPGRAATLKGKVVADAPAGGETTVTLSLGVPPSNTPHGGYSPRRKWPAPVVVKVEKDGTFTAAGLTPGSNYMTVTAKGHADVSQTVRLEAGKEKDQGEIRLRSTDLGFYTGKPAPKTGELAWEKDYETAMKKAAAEKKPVLVMMTATWCGPCKLLEKETLNDPWVRHFLSGFVLVKAYEDKDVEKTYGLAGYPTLVFTDSSGKAAHRTTGYKPALPFLSQCVKGFEKLEMKLPEELQKLVDKKVLPAE